MGVIPVLINNRKREPKLVGVVAFSCSVSAVQGSKDLDLPVLFSVFLTKFTV